MNVPKLEIHFLIPKKNKINLFLNTMLSQLTDCVTRQCIESAYRQVNLECLKPAYRQARVN